ncbi:MAG: o-succinylbenzoate--CoA ligase [Candidatus Hydrogenedentes bacterium]|nr:o-succinylbenzoate--CoA ligase [Candidatus Hydrogenedentota bacterium]
MSEIPCPVAVHAARDPDSVALAGPSINYSYRDLDTAVSMVAKNLRAGGIRRGDIVALHLSSCVEYPILLLGVIRLGAIAFPLNTHLPAAGIVSALESVRCSNLIAAADLLPPKTSASIRVFAPRDVLASRHTIRPRLERVTTDRPAVIVMTSGSSGQPKAAVLTYGNLHANASASNASLPLAPGNRWLLSLPLYHVSGLGVVFRCIVAGATIAIAEGHEELPESITRCAVGHISLVATQLIRLMQQQPAAEALTSLKAILLGGSALPASMLRAALERGLPIYISYGLTEMASQVATARLTELSPDQRPAARVLIPRSVRINAESEIEVQGPTLFRGYLRGDSVSRPLTADGWFRTGDLGRLDASNGLIVLGRKDNMFISGGENIQPEEIEALLSGIDGIAQTVVVPVKDPVYGHRPVAFIEPVSEQCPDSAALTEILARTLPPYKIPRVYLPWPTELRGQGIKVNRKRLAQRAEELAGQP